MTELPSIIGIFAATFLLGLGIGLRQRKAAGKESLPASASPKVSASHASVLMDNLAASVVLRDAEDRIIYCSPFTEVLTGYALTEIQSHQDDFFLSIMHEADRDKYSRALKISKVGEAFQFRFRFLHKSGIEIWAEMRTVPLQDSQGRGTGSLSVTLDVTGTMRYQQQVEEKNRDLQDFAYMLSHDLKAPLTTFKGMLNVIEEDHAKELSAAVLELLAHMKRASNRLEQLVTRVVEFSKLSSQEFRSECVDLNSLLKDVSRDFAQALSDCGGQISLRPDLPQVQADPVHLHRVFANLIGNAIKYRATARALDLRVKLASSPNRRNVNIVIEDNGSGIPESAQANIFRPFHRAHGNAIEGSGIGLASAKRIMEKMGGEIVLAQSTQNGTSFSLTLKAADRVS